MSQCSDTSRVRALDYIFSRNEIGSRTPRRKNAVSARTQRVEANNYLTLRRVFRRYRYAPTRPVASRRIDVGSGTDAAVMMRMSSAALFDTKLNESVRRSAEIVNASGAPNSN